MYGYTINSLRLIIITNRGCLSFWSLYTLTVITVNIASPALGIASLYKDLYEDETNETFILYQSYICMTVILVPLVSTIQYEKYPGIKMILAWLESLDIILLSYLSRNGASFVS